MSVLAHPSTLEMVCGDLSPHCLSIRRRYFYYYYFCSDNGNDNAAYRIRKRNQTNIKRIHYTSKVSSTNTLRRLAFAITILHCFQFFVDSEAPRSVTRRKVSNRNHEPLYLHRDSSIGTKQQQLYFNKSNKKKQQKRQQSVTLPVDKQILDEYDWSNIQSTKDILHTAIGKLVSTKKQWSREDRSIQIDDFVLVLDDDKRSDIPSVAPSILPSSADGIINDLHNNVPSIAPFTHTQQHTQSDIDNHNKHHYSESPSDVGTSNFAEISSSEFPSFSPSKIGVDTVTQHDISNPSGENNNNHISWTPTSWSPTITSTPSSFTTSGGAIPAPTLVPFDDQMDTTPNTTEEIIIPTLPPSTEESQPSPTFVPVLAIRAETLSPSNIGQFHIGFVDTTGVPSLFADMTDQPSLPVAQVDATAINTLSPSTVGGIDDILKYDDASCSAHPACSTLAGNCCPNDAGLFLICCETIVPTPTTTSLPTSNPTASETTTPTETLTTINPTVSPVTNAPIRTAHPTKEPSEIPTNAPANSPSSEPTQKPTPVPDEPTAGPIVSTTEIPTRKPLRTRTLEPSYEPINRATTKPPSDQPALKPSDEPRRKPTRRPTRNPSASPSASLAPTTTFQPSVTPTPKYEFNITNLNTPDVLMEFGIGRRRLQAHNNATLHLSKTCINKWRTYVQDSIEKEVDQVVPGYETLNVDISNLTTSNRTNLIIFSFDVLIEIRSAVQTHDVNRYIEGPFDSKSEQDKLIAYLKSTKCEKFVNLRSVEVTIPSTDPTGAEEGVNQKSSQSSQLGLIIGLAVAIGAVIMVTVAFIIIKTRKRRQLLLDDDEDGPMFDSTSVSDRAGKNHEYVSEIGINTHQDVSTLGDPLPPGYARSRAGDDLSTIESTTLDYDYQKAYLETHSNSDLVSEVTGPPVDLTDDGIETVYDSTRLSSVNPAPREAESVKSRKSFLSTKSKRKSFTRPNVIQEPFEVLAPPGVLGLIIESNKEGGYPTVHSIKKDSVLSGVVREGDRVLSIDDEDVTTMNAGEASSLIASKKKQAVRKFVFSRASTLDSS